MSDDIGWGPIPELDDWYESTGFTELPLSQDSVLAEFARDLDAGFHDFGAAQMVSPLTVTEDSDDESLTSVAFHTIHQVAPMPEKKKKRYVDVDEALRTYITDDIRDKDVLLGRGGLSNKHPGNQDFLEHKRTLQGRYALADCHRKKKAISEELVQWVLDRGGRFLCPDKSDQRWYLAPHGQARQKASQTLREKSTPESRAQKRAKYKKPCPKAPRDQTADLAMSSFCVSAALTL